jgi:hypothetical protein
MGDWKRFNELCDISFRRDLTPEEEYEINCLSRGFDAEALPHELDEMLATQQALAEEQECRSSEGE